jgi:hypothetical protein
MPDEVFSGLLLSNKCVCGMTNRHPCGKVDESACMLEFLADHPAQRFLQWLVGLCHVLP